MKFTVAANLLFLFSASMMTSSHAETYYIPIEGHCWRFRLLPNAFLVGYANDPHCLYFPPDSTNTPPSGWKPGRVKISKMKKQIGNMYYYEKVTASNGDPNVAWNGTVEVVRDAQYKDATVITQNIDYTVKDFTVKLGILPKPTASPVRRESHRIWTAADVGIEPTASTKGMVDRTTMARIHKTTGYVMKALFFLDPPR